MRPGRVLGLAGPHLMPMGRAGPGFRPERHLAPHLSVVKTGRFRLASIESYSSDSHTEEVCEIAAEMSLNLVVHYFAAVLALIYDSTSRSICAV